MPDARILMIEKGRSIEKRVCPKRKTGECVNCDPCNITTGFSGSGSFSDGKLSINDHGEVGGDLAKYIGLDRYREILASTDNIYLEYGADPQVYGAVDQSVLDSIRRRAFQADLHFIDSKVRHLGTEKAYEIYARIQKALKELGIEMWFNTFVADLLIEQDADGESTIKGVITKDGRQVLGERVVVSIGREGCNWLKSMCEMYNIATQIGTIDIGVRMETGRSDH